MTRIACLGLCGLVTALVVQAVAGIDDSWQPPDVEKVAWPDARVLMAKLLSTFPSVPIEIRADLVVTDPDGAILKRLGATAFLAWDLPRAFAHYRIYDAFGGLLEELKIEWAASGRRCEHRGGDTGSWQPLRDLTQEIQGTDVTWMDLTLAFLRWPEGKTVGEERVKGRYCYIVDLPAPADETLTYGGMRVWVDPEIGILMQAVAYDPQGLPVKMLEVRSFKKIRNVWVVKDIDVYRFPTAHGRTRFRVLQAEAKEDLRAMR